MTKFSLIAICLLFLLLPSGCKKVRVVTWVAPSLPVESYADAGTTLEWDPVAGQGFEIKFTPTTISPCKGNEPLTSDGKKPVVCHLKKNRAGFYQYTIVISNTVAPTGTVPSGAPGVFAQRVGPCKYCSNPSGFEFVSANTSGLATRGAQSIELDECSTPSQTATAQPPSLSAPAGTKVYWTYAGDDPPDGTSPISVVLPAGVCSNSGTPTTITNPYTACTLTTPSSNPYTYQISVYNCTNPGSASLTVQ